jgi:hypothetical protein
MRDEEDGGGIEAGGVAPSGAFDKSMGDDSGWKQVHGDVFRKPVHVEIYAALLGSGTQLLLLALAVIFAALAGSLYVDRGAVSKAVVVAYALTSAAGGFVSGQYYRSQFFPEPAPQWPVVMLLTAAGFPGAVFVTVLLLNLIATGYGTSNVVSLLTLFKVRWGVVLCPRRCAHICMALPDASFFIGRTSVGVRFLASRYRGYHRGAPCKHETERANSH